MCSDTDPVSCKFLFRFDEVNRKRVLDVQVVVGRGGLFSLAQGDFYRLISVDAQTKQQSLGEFLLTFW